MRPYTLAAAACGVLLQQQQALAGNSHHHRGPKLLLEETFDEGFDLSLWKHEITAGGIRGGSWEFQYFTNNRTNSYVKDGALHITPSLSRDIYGHKGVTGNVTTTLELWGVTPASQCTSNQNFGCVRASSSLAGLILPPIQSARVRTAGTFSFKYGRVEVEAKLPRGDWLHPSIWLLPEYEQYGMWPASGEIDIVNSRGNAPGYSVGGVDTIASQLHYGSDYAHDAGYSTMKQYTLPDGATFADDYHKFGLVWTPQSVYTYVDDDSNRVMEVDITQSFYESSGLAAMGMNNPWDGGSPAAPFDSPFYLVFDLSVGGTTYFPDGEGKPWNNTDPKAGLKFYDATDSWMATWEDPSLHIKSVRVWEHAAGENHDDDHDHDHDHDENGYDQESSSEQLVQAGAVKQMGSGFWPVALLGALAGFLIGVAFTVRQRERNQYMSLSV